MTFCATVRRGCVSSPCVRLIHLIHLNNQLTLSTTGGYAAFYSLPVTQFQAEIKSTLAARSPAR